MKKILLTITFMLFGLIPAFADTMVVQAQSEISTTKPDEIVKVQVLRDCTLNGTELKIGYVLCGKIIVTDAKRLKRNATFTFYPLNYTDLEGNTVRFSKLYYGKFSAQFELDAKKLAESAVLGVANHFFDGVKTGFYAVKGAVQNEQGNRLKSSATSVYEHSPLSYIEKGGDLNIPKETVFGLKFKECENAPKEN